MTLSLHDGQGFNVWENFVDYENKLHDGRQHSFNVQKNISVKITRLKDQDKQKSIEIFYWKLHKHKCLNLLRYIYVDDNLQISQQHRRGIIKITFIWIFIKKSWWREEKKKIFRENFDLLSVPKFFSLLK